MKNHYALCLYDDQGILFHTYTYHISEREKAQREKVNYQALYPSFAIVLYFIQVERI
jgi:hypothetical protein